MVTATSKLLQLGVPVYKVLSENQEMVETHYGGNVTTARHRVLLLHTVCTPVWTHIFNFLLSQILQDIANIRRNIKKEHHNIDIRRSMVENIENMLSGSNADPDVCAALRSTYNVKICYYTIRQ